MGGKGPGSGFDFQSRLIALVNVHILAHRPLGWVALATRDIPSAVTAEGGGSGDDLRVELVGTQNLYECQAKRGLSADTRLDHAVDCFARGMPAAPAELGLLLVDPSSSGTITQVLRDGLDAWRQGTRPKLKGSLERVINRLRSASAESVADRLYVRMLDVEQDASAAAQNAILILERILDDPDQASAAWAVLVTDGLRMCREGGRRDYAALVARLGQDNIHLSGTPQGATQRLVRIESRLESRATRTDEQLEELKEIFLTGRASITTPPASPTSELDRYTVQLDAAKGLIDGGRATAALELLRSMGDEVSSAALPTRVRFHNLVASALLHLERAADGRHELQTVLILSPNDTTALANMAQAESIAGNVEGALRYADRVLELDPLSESAWVVLVQGRPGIQVPEDLAASAIVLTAAGFADSVAGRWDSAVDNLRRAMLSGFEEERALYLAQALYGRAFAEPEPVRDTEALAEARALLDRVIASLNGRSDSRAFERALITRGQLELLRENEELADADFAEAAAQFPSSPHAAHQLSMSYLRRDDPERALFTVERLPEHERTAALHTVRARALLALGRKDEVRDELGRAVEKRLHHARNHADLTLGLAEIAVEADLPDLAERLLGEPELEPAWLVNLLKARLAGHLGDDTGAAEAYGRALAGAPRDVHPYVAEEYAEQLRAHGDAGGAVSVLESVSAAGLPSLRSTYARALFDSREFTKAAALVRTAEKEGGDLPVWALLLGTQVALVREDIPAAIGYLRQLHERFPRNLEHGIRLAQVSLRGQDRIAALQVLDELREAEGASPRQLLQIAAVYIRAGEAAHALPLAYRAMRMEPDAEDVQLAYVQIFMRRRAEQEGLNAEAVEADTAVTLTTSRGETLSYFLVSDMPRRAAQEIALEDELARLLLGKRVGDEVVLRPGAASEAVAKVKEVRSKYIYVFQDILLHFNERHPQSTALQSFPIPEEPTASDIEFLRDEVRAEADSAARIVAAYHKAGSLPLGVLASWLKGTIRDAYALLANDATGPFMVELAANADASVDAARSGLPVILTRSALVTVQELELYGIVEAMCLRLVVPWSLIEELQDERLQHEERARKGFDSLLRDGDTMVRQHLSKEYMELVLTRFDEMVSWVRKRCEILPRPLESIDGDEDQPSHLRNLIGASSHDALALAVDIGAQVYADDLSLRGFLHEQTGRFGFSSHGLIRAAEAAGRCSSDDAEGWTVSLLLLRHAEILMTADTLMAALRESDYRVDGRVAPLIDLLRDHAVPQTSVIMFCIETLIRVAAAPSGSQHVGAITYALLEAACAGRDTPSMLHVIEQIIRQRLLVLPEAMDSAVAALNRYMRINVMGESPLHLG